MLTVLSWSMHFYMHFLFSFFSNASIGYITYLSTKAYFKHGTIIDNIFETNFRFHVKKRTT